VKRALAVRIRVRGGECDYRLWSATGADCDVDVNNKNRNRRILFLSDRLFRGIPRASHGINSGKALLNCG
jgi:hypothetical protein